MTLNEEHLSTFELDLHFASSAPDARIERHVAACARCSAYVSELGVLQESAPALAAAPPRGPSRRARARTLGWTAAGLAVLGTVTALLLAVPGPEAPAVAVKGGPAVQLLVRRGGETRPWDGTSRVRAGDALGLRVVCEGFLRVSVAAASREEPGRWARLSEDPCPRAGAALPFTLVVDGAPARERFAVVFSKSTLEERELGRAIERRQLDGDAWVTRFELDKETAP
jgi:hypothetical protein